MTPWTPLAAIRSLLPRATVPVLTALDRSGALCTSELAAATCLPNATVRYAVRKLVDAGCVATHWDLGADGRKRYHRITGLGREVARALGGDHRV